MQKQVREPAFYCHTLQSLAETENHAILPNFLFVWENKIIYTYTVLLVLMQCYF